MLRYALWCEAGKSKLWNWRTFSVHHKVSGVWQKQGDVRLLWSWCKTNTAQCGKFGTAVDSFLVTIVGTPVPNSDFRKGAQFSSSKCSLALPKSCEAAKRGSPQIYRYWEDLLVPWNVIAISTKTPGPKAPLQTTAQLSRAVIQYTRDNNLFVDQQSEVSRTPKISPCLAPLFREPRERFL